MHLKTILISLLILPLIFTFLSSSGCKTIPNKSETRDFNGPYKGLYLNRIAFPIGGMGAGMVCLEGTGALSHVSVRNRFQFFHEPCTFATICVKGPKNIARVLEGPVHMYGIMRRPFLIFFQSWKEPFAALSLMKAKMSGVTKLSAPPCPSDL